MILLFDIGNTHTHVGLANEKRVVTKTDMPTHDWFAGKAGRSVAKIAGAKKITGAVLCSVVPRATPFVRKTVRVVWKLETLELNPKPSAAWALIIPSQIPSGRTVWETRSRRDFILARRLWWWILARR